MAEYASAAAVDNEHAATRGVALGSRQGIRNGIADDRIGPQVLRARWTIRGKQYGGD